MGPFIYQGRTSRRVRIDIAPRTEFRRILRTFEDLELPECGLSRENIMFAVLELINNSLRAHRERQVPRPITVLFLARHDSLAIRIRDYGGGFDPRALPWSLEEDHHRVDIQSAAFQEYRRQHGYLRFGMGLLIARRTFPCFELVFVDDQDRPLPWTPGRVAGTLILLGTKGDRNGQ